MLSFRSHAVNLGILAVGITLLAVPMLGQTFYGSIVGVVSDSTGAVMPGVTMTLSNNRTGAVQTIVTSADGAYRFVNLTPGSYRLDGEQSGFRHYTRAQIEVNVEAAVRLDIAMQVGEVSEVVEVTTETPLLQTENASLSQVVAARSVQELPLNGRNVLNLVSLVPGVVPQGSTDGSLTGKNVFAAGNYQIGGGTANQSASYFDGAPMNTTYGNSVVLVPSQDVVSEFRVQTNNNSAEYGRYTGGVINMASKSGSNEFHGSAYEFLRNKVLNANNFFANRGGVDRGAFTQNQFGATLGGPIVRDKTFFYFGYEGFRQRFPNLFLVTVPTVPMLGGDFSEHRNSSGALIPIYDPLTTCGQFNNPACGSDNVTREQFANNQIPASRISPVSERFVRFPVYALPNIPGRPFTNQFNFTKNDSIGGDNDQFNIRGDQNVSENNRMFGRYTRWRSKNKAADPYGNQLLAGSAPEEFVTQQAVLADTHLFSPTTIFDIRLSVLRWDYSRIPGNLGIDIGQAFGMPSYYSQIAALNGVDPSTAVPFINVAGYNQGGTGLIYSKNTSYAVASTLTKIAGRHNLKFGGEARRLDWNYFQNNEPGGLFGFDNLFTSRNALSPGATGNSFASFLLGYASSGTVQTSPFTAARMNYQGYFINDTIQVTDKLTLNLGVRWEIPGVYTERFDRLVTFNPTLANPELKGITVNGQPVLGGFDLVNSPNHPERGLRPEKFGLFAPRAGISYRLTDRTVVRTGAGIFYIPADVKFQEGPYRNPVSIFRNEMVGTKDNSVTPTNDLSDPYPGGFLPAPGREERFQRVILGGTLTPALREIDYGYTAQWNFTVQHEFGGGIAVEAAYAGLRGVHLPNGNKQINQLPDQYLSMGSSLRQQVENPFFGLITNGTLSQRTVQLGELLRPFPQYQSMALVGGYVGNSTYHSLQLKGEKRFPAGGRLLASYTFSKTLTDVETVTDWLEGGQVSGFQNANNLRLEKALSSFDSRQRLVFSYVIDLPVGKGKKFLPNLQGVADKLISGWGINGVTTFQEGFPLGFTASPNLTGFST